MYFGVGMLVAFAIFYYRLGEITQPDEGWDPTHLCAVSVLVSILTRFALGWGFLGCLFGQVSIFVGMTVRNELKARKK
jgi:hypothetical protein